MSENRLAPGDPAPDFTLPDADGNDVSLSALRGKPVIIYFYPAAMTPGCTKQACDFTAAMPDLTAEGVAVLGISPDPPAKLAKFRDALGVGRKTAQLYLERFDADGVTRRVGDARVLRRRT